MNSMCYRLTVNPEAKPERLLWGVAALGGLLIGIAFAATESVSSLVIHLGILILVAKAIQWADRSRDVEFVVESDRLKIRGDLWGTEILKTEFEGKSAAILDLTEALEFRPVMKLMGTGLFDYQSGWYLLRNGSRALIFLTDRKRVAYLPRKKGAPLLLSVEKPEDFLKEVV